LLFVHCAAGCRLAGHFMQTALKHLLLDFLANAFFLLVVALTGNIPLAIALGIGVGLTQIAVQKYLGVPVPPIQLMALGLVVVLGGAAGLAATFRTSRARPCLPLRSSVPDTPGRA
jgi:hypothetical protein